MLYFIVMNSSPSLLIRCTIDHPLTPVTLFGAKKGGALTIMALSLGRRCSFDGKKALESSDPMMLIHAESINRFLDGSLRDLSGIPIDLSTSTPFERKVLKTARSIPWGQVISYAELARRTGNPRAVRASASVMRRNRFPLIVPCHRVIRSDGSIGGFMGKQNGRPVQLKKHLLERERPAITGN
jgi:methylated-DNA-[protein]-cysteine S-methyltransferase